MMQIAGYLRTSLIEWPGKIASVIFTPGCNFACPFCHNRDLVEPLQIKTLAQYRDQSVLADLEARRNWIDGVVITGGEPTLQVGITKFLKKLKELGFATMLETNGSQPQILKKMIRQELVDFLAMDYKTILADYAWVVTPKAREQKLKLKPDLVIDLKKSMRLIIESGLPFELRTTVVPQIHNLKVLLQMAQELKKLTSQLLPLASVPWVLQPFQAKNCLDQTFNQIKPFPRAKLKKFLKSIKKVLPKARVRD